MIYINDDVYEVSGTAEELAAEAVSVILELLKRLPKDYKYTQREFAQLAISSINKFLDNSDGSCVRSDGNAPD